MSAQAPARKRSFSLLGQRSLAVRLTLTLLPLTLLPLLVFGLAAYQRSRALIRSQVVTHLQQSVEAQAQRLEDWRTTHEVPLWTATQSGAFAAQVADLLQSQQGSRRTSVLQEEMVARLLAINGQEPDSLYTGLMLVRISDGYILAATPTFWQGESIADLAEMPMTATHVTREMVFSRATPISLVTTMPVPFADGESQAVLVGLSNDVRLGEVIQDPGMSTVPQTDLYIALPPDTVVHFDALNRQLRVIRVADHPAFAPMVAQGNGSLEFQDVGGENVVAYYRWLPEFGAGLLLEMPQTIAYAGLNTLAVFTVVILLATLLLVAVIVPVFTRRSLRPLGTLAEMAERIATGDLRTRVPVDHQDEIGRLSGSFNNMADQLSELYRDLENRVVERTRQIRTAAEVARDAAAVRDIDELLTDAVQLVSERFGFYHAGLFLLDAKREYAVLRAASSEGGRRMLQRGHKLPVGKMGIVGFVTETGQARIAADVGADAVHFANPDLPETRSEMAVPLRVGGRVVGALDVQSVEQDAFDPDDVLVLQTVADQLAIAIENASLFTAESQRATQRRQVIEVSRQLSERLGYRELLHQSTELIRRAFGYQRVTLGLVEGTEVVIRASSATAPTRPLSLGARAPVGQGVLGRAVALKSPMMVPDLAADERMPLISASEAQPRSLLAVPLLTRGRAIGAIVVEQLEPHSLGEPDAEVLETLSGIVAIAVENARLFEDMEQSLQQVDALYRQQTRDAWEDVIAARSADPARRSYEYVLRAGYPGEENEPPLEVPIALRGESIGTIRAEAPESPVGWGEVDKEVLESVAEEVATALEQIRLLGETQRRAAQLQAAAEIARDATGLLDLPTLLLRAVELIQTRFNLYHVAVFLLDEDGESATVRQATGQAAPEIVASEVRHTAGSASVIGRVIQTGEPYVAHDASSDPLCQRDPRLPESRSEVGLPLKIGQRVIGALDIRHTELSAFTEEDVAALQILADQLSVAVQNARLFDETLRRARREQSILEITNKIRSCSDIDSMMRVAVQELRSTLGAKQATIRLIAETVGSDGDGHGSTPSPPAPIEPKAEEAA
jgi:GAF domain-containing protein/HAMP domain-containing protein